MFSKNNPIVLFLERNGFSLYQSSLTSILKFAFPPETVVNLDVINREQLINLIYSFIKTNKIIPSNLIIVILESIVYEKDLANNTSPTAGENFQLSREAVQSVSAKEQQEKEIQNFLENIPFEELFAKIVKLGETERLIAVNKDLAESIMEPFRKIGCIVEAIIPSFMYGKSVDFASGLTREASILVLRRPDIIKIGNLLTNQHVLNTQQHLESPTIKQTEKKPKNIKLYIMIGVFVIVLIILAIVYFALGNTSGPSKKSTNPNLAPKVSSSITPTLSISPSSVSSSEATLSMESISVKIVQSDATEETVSTLVDGLKDLGFKNITTTATLDSIPARSSVSFSKNIPDDMRQNAVLEINNILPGILILESGSSDSTITILIGQS